MDSCIESSPPDMSDFTSMQEILRMLTAIQAELASIRQANVEVRSILLRQLRTQEQQKGPSLP